MINRLKIIITAVVLAGVLSGCAGSDLQVPAGVYVLKASALPEKICFLLDVESELFEYTRGDPGNETVAGHALMEGKQVKCSLPEESWKSAFPYWERGCCPWIP